jgi:hypothetical protein
MVDFGKMVDKAKDWAGQNPEKADGFVEKGEDFANSRFAGHEQQVDQFGEKAKDFLHGDQQAPPAQEGQAPPPPPPGEEPRP